MKVCISDFKARSLKLLDEIHHSGKSITVTKRGKPIAKVVPICDHKNEIDLKGTLIEQDEDIFSTGEKWDSNSWESPDQRRFRSGLLQTVEDSSLKCGYMRFEHQAGFGNAALRLHAVP